MLEPRNYSVNGYCDRYGYRRSKVYEDIKSGDLKIIKVGNRTLIPIEAAEALQHRRMMAAGITPAAA